MSGSAPRNFRIVPAVDRAARVLSCFGPSNEELGVSELADSVFVNKGSLYQLLLTLCEHGFLIRNPATRKYRLGYALLELGSVVLRGLDLLTTAKPLLRSLALQTSETVLLGILDGHRVLIVDHEESGLQMRVAANVGVRMPLYAGSFATILLGSLPDSDLEELLCSHPLPRFTDKSVIDAVEYQTSIHEARTRGWAVDDGGYLPGVRAICAPVRGAKGQMVAAISLVGFAHDVPHHRLQQLIDSTVRTAERVSTLIGVNHVA